MPRERDLAVAAHAVLIARYRSVKRAAADLGIPETRLYSAFQSGCLDKLQLGDIRKIAPLMREELVDDVRAYYLP